MSYPIRIPKSSQFFLVQDPFPSTVAESPVNYMANYMGNLNGKLYGKLHGKQNCKLRQTIC
jgi:hypothetical protein